MKRRKFETPKTEILEDGQVIDERAGTYFIEIVYTERLLRGRNQGGICHMRAKKNRLRRYIQKNYEMVEPRRIELLTS